MAGGDLLEGAKERRSSLFNKKVNNNLLLLVAGENSEFNNAEKTKRKKETQQIQVHNQGVLCMLSFGELLCQLLLQVLTSRQRTGEHRP